ncbi:MAG: tetratricopeptide repeat protein [Desulfarculaceae bacterium]|nr:tetratricopeptide repeat protein [Desulfarculaceae bacterium]
MNEKQTPEAQTTGSDHVDPFQKKVFEFIAFARRHKKPLAIAGCAVLAAILIVSGVLYSIQNAERKASDLLARSLNTYQKMSSNGSDGYSAVSEDFKRLLQEYPNTKAGKIGNFRFAGICYDAAKYERAYELYNRALSDFKNDPVMESLIRNALGRTCIALEKYEEAEQSFKRVSEIEKSVMKDEAVFSLGMIAEKSRLGTHDQFYRDLLKNHPQSIYQPLAQSKTATFE